MVLDWKVKRGNDTGRFTGTGPGSRCAARHAGGPLSPAPEPPRERHVLVLRQAGRQRAQVLQQGLLNRFRRGSRVRTGRHNPCAGLALGPVTRSALHAGFVPNALVSDRQLLQRLAHRSWRWQANSAPRSRSQPPPAKGHHPTQPTSASTPRRHSIGHLSDINRTSAPGLSDRVLDIPPGYRTSIGQAEELAGQAVGQVLLSARIRPGSNFGPAPLPIVPGLQSVAMQIDRALGPSLRNSLR